MKNIIKILILTLLLSSCDDTEPIMFNGATGIGFEDTGVEVSVPDEGITSTIVVTSTTLSTESRTYNVKYLESLPNSTDSWLPLPETNLSFGMITIPAGEYSGTLDVSINNDGLEDFVEYRFQVEVDLEGSGFPPVSYFVLKEFDITTFACSDLRLIINLDDYSSENTWELTDSTGAILYSGGPYADGRRGETEIVNGISLTEGCYTFTFFDSYEDGLADGVIEGDYSLVCAEQNVVVYASGVGNFGASNSTDFCIVE